MVAFWVSTADYNNERDKFIFEYLKSGQTVGHIESPLYAGYKSGAYAPRFIYFIYGSIECFPMVYILVTLIRVTVWSFKTVRLKENNTQ